MVDDFLKVGVAFAVLIVDGCLVCVIVGVLRLIPFVCLTLEVCEGLLNL